ncbi:Serine/threonine-protein phosphatase PGAM5, partial [Durusdinium trenchii]
PPNPLCLQGRGRSGVFRSARPSPLTRLLAPTIGLSVAAKRLKNLRTLQPSLRGVASDEHGIVWLASENGKEDVIGEVLELPVLPVEDVYLPGAPVILQVTDPSVRNLYDSLLLSGGRYVATVLFNQESSAMAAVGTLLYLEDFREAPGGYVAEHTACGRCRLRTAAQCASRMEVELLTCGSDTESSLPTTRLEPQLSQLERLRQKRGIPSGLKESLHLDPPLPPALQAVQGLWQVKSGVRVRIDQDQVGQTK